MARIRTIKPDFFTSEDVVSLSPMARLLYIALWCEADREGRLVWRPATFKLRYIPGDKVNIEALCKELTTRRLVVRYGEGYAHIPTFLEHQHINPREAPSILPAPDACLTRDDASHLDVHSADPDMHVQVGREGKGKERKEGVASERDASPPKINGHTQLRPQALEILTFLNEKAGRDYQPVAANIDLIIARLKEGATVPDLRAVVAKKCREWKGDEKMDEYLRPKTLFNATNFAQYRGELIDVS